MAMYSSKDWLLSGLGLKKDIDFAHVDLSLLRVKVLKPKMSPLTERLELCSKNDLVMRFAIRVF